jgi:hypothetical protein
MIRQPLKMNKQENSKLHPMVLRQRLSEAASLLLTAMKRLHLREKNQKNYI